MVVLTLEVIPRLPYYLFCLGMTDREARPLQARSKNFNVYCLTSWVVSWESDRTVMCVGLLAAGDDNESKKAKVVPLRAAATR